MSSRPRSHAELADAVQHLDPRLREEFCQRRCIRDAAPSMEFRSSETLGAVASREIEGRLRDFDQRLQIVEALEVGQHHGRPAIRERRRDRHANGARLPCDGARVSGSRRDLRPCRCRRSAHPIDTREGRRDLRPDEDQEGGFRPGDLLSGGVTPKNADVLSSPSCRA